MTVVNEALWDQIHSGDSKEGLLATRLIPESKHNLFAALDPVSGNRYLILKTDKKSRPKRLPSGKGFSLSITGPHIDPDGRHRLIFSLSDGAFADIFNIISTDVVAEVKLSDSDLDAIDAFLERVSRWQQFLDRRQDGVLSEQAQIGLLGEAILLRDLISQGIDASEAVTAWAGPDAMAKDFQLKTGLVESKATTLKGPLKVKISSEIQLQKNDARPLFLSVFALEKVENGDVTLPGVIAGVMGLLDGQPGLAHELTKKLLEVGYRFQDRDHYTQSYSIRKKLHFEVVEEFPCLKEKGLPPGIGEVSYSLAIDACMKHAIGENEMMERLAKRT